VTSLADLDLHDATLISASLAWGSRSVDVDVQRFDGGRGSILRLRAVGCSRVVIPHEAPWGPSASINSCGLDGRRFWIEMQSGDTIEIWADRIEVL
jgi:hypothetical protein